jgi:hypothetical protein
LSVRLLNWPGSDHSSYYHVVSCAVDVAAVAFAGFVGVSPPVPVPLHSGVHALVPAVSLLLRGEPVALLSLFAPPRSGTSWDRIQSSFLRVVEPIQSLLLD